MFVHGPCVARAHIHKLMGLSSPLPLETDNISRFKSCGILLYLGCLSCT
jgi:hypothetical protein